MKTCAIVWLVVSLSFSLSGAVLSEKTNGLYIAIAGVRPDGEGATNGLIGATDELVLQTFSDSNPTELAYPGPEYCLEFSMVGPDGTKVSKAAAGKRPGSKFGALPDPTRARVGLLFAWGPYADNPGLDGGKPIGRPEKLFQMHDPGIYELVVRVALYRRQGNGPAPPWKPTFFSPIRLRVRK